VEKAVLALGMLVLAVALPPFPASPVIAVVMAAAALIGAAVPFRLWLACATAPAGFLLVGAFSLAFQWDGGGFSLAQNGLHLAAGLAARSLAGVCCLLFLALTTPTSDLLNGLRRAGLPAELAEIALLMYRFLFLLAEVAAAMDAAQAARLGHVGVGRRLRSLGLLIANLLPRALDRARRLEIGLAARGWTGELRVLSPKAAPSLPVLAAIGAMEGGVLLLGVLV
jgi:cobalt/nickel transport system permease protein